MARMLPAFPTDPRRRDRQERARAVARYVAQRPEETTSHVLDELGDRKLARQAGFAVPVETSTALRYLRHPEAHPKANPVGKRRKKRSDEKWTLDVVTLAVLAWWERHGAPPTKMDWSPNRIRYKRHATMQARLDAFAAGWTAPDGTHWPFPRSDRVAFDFALERACRHREEH